MGEFDEQTGEAEGAEEQGEQRNADDPPATEANLEDPVADYVAPQISDE